MESTTVAGLIGAAATAGQSWKADVVAASTANINIASALVNGAVVDGVTLATGNRVLLIAQTDATQNGIYVVAASGAASRSTDANTSALITGTLVFVAGGTANGNKQFALTTPAPIALGTTALTFTAVIDQGAVNASAVQPLVDEAQAAAASINGVVKNVVDPTEVMAFTDGSPQQAIIALIKRSTGELTFIPDPPTAASLTNADQAATDVNGLVRGSGKRLVSLMAPISKTALATITVGNPDTSLTSVYHYQTSPSLFVANGPVVSGTPTFAIQGSYYPHGSGGNQGAFSQCAGAVSTTTTSRYVQWRVTGAGSSHFRIWVDGVPACDPTPTGASIGDGSTYVHIDLGTVSVKSRKITLEVELNVGVYVTNTVCVSPGAVITAPDRTWQRNIGFVSDSYGQSTGSSAQMLGLVYQLARILGGFDTYIINESVGGTGWLNPGGLGTGTIIGSVAGNTGTFGDPNRIANVVAGNPNMVVFAGGQNDFGSVTGSALQTAVQSTLSSYRSALPGIPFWVNGIWPASDGPSVTKCTMETYIRAAVDAMGDPLIRFTPMSVISADGVNPDKNLCAWYGTGHISAKNGTGPADFLIGGQSGSDTVHPGDDGHRWIAADRFAAFERISHYFKMAA
jgi:hypothetical protein